METDLNLANMIPVDPRQLHRGINPLTASSGIGPLLTEQGIVPVTVFSSGASKISKWDILNSTYEIDNHSVRFSDIGVLTQRSTSSAIRKENRQYLRIVSFEYLGMGQQGEDILRRIIKEANNEMPIGYSAEKISYGFVMDGNFSRYYLLGLLLLVNYMICCVMFENLIQPFAVISLVPISFIGLFFVFYITEFAFDQGGYAAFIFLGAIVINSGIFIVNDYNFNAAIHRSRGKRLNWVLVKVIVNRTRTVILTNISAIFGLIPFLFDGPDEPFWFCLALGAIGGIVFSSASVFLALPIFLWKVRTIKQDI